jgi:hypothetical protein
MFDVLNGSETTEAIFDFDYDAHEQQGQSIMKQMRELGYRSHNSILNLGSLFLYLIVYLFKLIFIVPILMLFTKITGYGGKLYTWITKHMFYAEPILISVEGYMEFMISGYLNTQQFDANPLYNGEVMSVYVGYFSLFLTFVLMPALFIYLLKKPIEEIKYNKSFRNKWG